MIIGLAGNAGVGKDTAAARLAKAHGFVTMALADPLKQICKTVFGFTDHQLWGPSSARNEPDDRYRRADGTSLTPREALQLLGTEWGRRCHPDVWLRLGMRSAHAALDARAPGVIFTDVRFANEVTFLRAAGAKIVRIVRPQRAALASAHAAHISETELDNLPVETFDAILDNSGSLETLDQRLATLMRTIATDVVRV